MKLITEVTRDVKYITEAKESGGKNMYIQGIFMQAECQNRNGRLYEKRILEKALDSFQTLIKEKRALGELGHPPTPSVNLDKVSHNIVELHFDGNNVVGKAKLLETPMGKIAKSLIEEGCGLGVSSRGLGSLVEKNGIKYVADDFHLATVDIVADPSAPDAFVQGIMENASWLYVEGKGWIMEQTKENLKKGRITEERKIQAFERYLHFISKM